MKYITHSAELNREFRRLLMEYAHYYWMVAWAGNPLPHIGELLEQSGKIRMLVVGLHFFQTSPSFIETFNPLPTVRFIKSISGFFHSKVYLFVNNKDNWEVLVGSANFTHAAFNRNNEACVLLHSSEADTAFFQQVMRSIEVAWHQGTKFTDAELADYTRMAGRRNERDSEDHTGNNGDGGLGVALPIVRMTWGEYMDRIFRAGNGRITERINLLDIVAGNFERYPEFAQMPPLQRKQVGGYISAGQPVDFRLFGNMQNGTTFTSLINNDPAGISEALDSIPPDGEVSEAQFRLFVERFEAAVGGGNKYRSGSRLLAMKRPDIFFALSRGNNTRLAEDFGIRRIDNMNFDRYWTEIILTIQQAEWYRHPAPINRTEWSISAYRAAFMDAMYYQPVQ